MIGSSTVLIYIHVVCVFVAYTKKSLRYIFQNVEEQSYQFFTGTAEDLDMPVRITRQGGREEGEVRGRGTEVVEEEGEREGAVRDDEREGEGDGTEEDEDVVEGESGDSVHPSGPDLEVPMQYIIAYSSDVDTT